MQHCSKCVMPETAESLAFDKQGMCSVCTQVTVQKKDINWEERAGELDTLVALVKGKHDYDCILPFSGGKDSTFTLWHVVRELGLKPLVVRFDHGFMRPRVKDNALLTLRTLGVDCHTFTPNWEVVRKLMFESLRRRGDFCWHCHTGIFAYPMWVALQQEVPLVIWGEPSAEYSSFYSYDDDEEVDQRRFNSFINLGINAEDMLGMLDNTISDYPVTARDLKPFTYPSAREVRAKKIRSVCLGSYVPWDVRKQVGIIEQELGWQGDDVEGVPKDYPYEKIECFMQGVRDYIKYLKRGFGRTAHLTSIDIRNGRLTREEGVRMTEANDGRRPHALDLFLEYLGIDEGQFMDIVAPHVVAPHVMPTLEETQSKKPNERPWDYDLWWRSPATPAAQAKESDATDS